MKDGKFEPNTAVWRVNRDLSVQKLFDKVMIANSVCFSLNGQTMYFTDSAYNPSRIDTLSYFSDDRLPQMKEPLIVYNTGFAGDAILFNPIFFSACM